MVQLETESSIKHLLEAYPSMHSLYKRYERSILEDILTNLLADDVEGKIQRDVLAIMEFSHPGGEFCQQFESERFKLQEFQWPECPGLSTDHMRRLHRLYSRVITFIEDYISKATSEYPPRAYLGVPDLETGITSFMGNPLETRILRFTSLRRSERYRLLRAFVRYELLCNINSISVDRWKVPDRLKLLSASGTPNGPDPKDLLSVHEYYKALYGAVIAHCGDAWLPSLPSSSLAAEAREATGASTMHGRPLLYPDNIYFDAAVYEGDVVHVQADAAEELASRGLDILTRVINCLNNLPEGKLYIKKWLKTLVNEQEYGFEPWIRKIYDPHHGNQHSAYRELVTSSQFSGDFSKDNETGGRRDINAYLLGTESRCHYTPWWWEVHKLQLRIYWQRAWGLLDDQRFYPSTNRLFPTLDELAELHGGKPSEGYCFERGTKEGDSRGQRRSKHWQDYWAGIRPDYPKNMLFYNRSELRFFDDEVTLDLPEIWEDYKGGPGY